MTEPTGAVFLSYASQDGEAAARICNALRAAGIEVWFDQSELRGGDVWDRQIRKQIHDCALFVPIISAHSQARLEGYFRREWKLAADRTHDMAEEKAFLVPVVIDDTSERNASVPEKFRDVQWSRLPGGVTPRAFVEHVTRLLSPAAAHASVDIRSPAAAAAPDAASVPRPLSSSPTTSRQKQWALLMIAAVAVVGVGYLYRFVLSKRPAAGAQTSVAANQPGASAQSAIPEKSIAVLPFVDLSEKHDQEYFADGMAEEILNLLAKVPDLKVIGRTSSFQFKGKTDDLRKIGSTLGTTYVVEGSVRRSGNHLRVTAQLIDARDGTHRWSQTYDREASDTLKVQDEIAASLVRALELEVSSYSRLQGRALPLNSEVYDSYLRGLQALNRYDQSGLDEAVADFRHALELDPSFTPAAEQLTRSLFDQASFGFVAPKIGYEQARVAAFAALRLDSKSALAHAYLGSVHTEYDWDWPAAAHEMTTALAVAPNDPTVLLNAAWERMAVGQWREALQLTDRAIAADPLHPAVYDTRSWVYLRLRRLAEAESAARSLLEISPTFVYGHYDLGIALLMQDKKEAALAEMQKDTTVGVQTAGLAVVYQALHRAKDADAALARLEAQNAGDMATYVAEVYAFRGQGDQAFSWLERAYAQKDIWLWQIKGDPLLMNIERDARFKAFLRKMNLPE